MKAATNALALASLLLFAAPALANDFIKPTPVPSSRDAVKPAKSSTTSLQGNTDVLNNKIVKTTKNPDGTPKVAPGGKKPGAL
ncbi:MAG: hypothetical protein HY916_08215 [Desulfovibrio sp.]|nr:hypothetical protein [Desulfovibrio sp.]